MAEDHDRLDGIFEEFRKAKNTDMNRAKSLFHEFKTGLQRHIVWEEEILFPMFENKTGMHDQGPTIVMRKEHRMIKEFLEKIHDKLAGRETEGIPELEAGLLDVLKPHNDKEEGVLYPWIDNSLSEPEREGTFEKMTSLSPEKYDKCCG